MRLIDADELIRDLMEQIPLAENVPIFKDIIESQQTAYDIDKVVGELEDLKSQYEKIWLGINDDVERQIYIAKDSTMYNAIEIVKQGLKEQNK